MSSPRPELLVAPCSYQAAKYAVEKWHYSRSMPVGKTFKIGVWEAQDYTGVIIFSLGANKSIGCPYGLVQTEVCELTRVAVKTHARPVSEMLSHAIILLKQNNPGLRLIVSYADANQGHTGVIYQATNWFYTGEIESDLGQMINGEIFHRRTVFTRYGRQDMDFLRRIDPQAHYVRGKPKHKYLYPLDRAMRRQIAPLAQPYPKKDTRPVNGDTLATREAGRFDSEPGALVDSHD